MNHSELKAWMESHGMTVREGASSPRLSSRLLLSETNDGAVVAVSSEGDSQYPFDEPRPDRSLS